MNKLNKKESSEFELWDGCRVLFSPVAEILDRELDLDYKLLQYQGLNRVTEKTIIISNNAIINMMSK